MNLLSDVMSSSALLLADASAATGKIELGRAVEVMATILFALAILHTFCVKFFARLAHKYPEGSLQENLFHFLAETEIVLGIWAGILFLAIIVFRLSVEDASNYIETLNFNEPKFVLVIMVVAATRPVVNLAESIILWIARLLPVKESVSFYVAALAFGSLLGSFITEPAAMTLLAMLLKRRYFDMAISKKLAYATIGLLFVNVSIGGTLTHFAAPPVLMVASKWEWSTWFMAKTFGWRAALSSIVSTLIVVGVFWKQLNAVEVDTTEQQKIPGWLTGAHVFFLGLIVAFSHHPDIFFGIFMIFLGLVTATKEYQEPLKLKEGLLVGFFLAGLVTMGSLQEYWVKPLITSLQDAQLYFGATALTAITDNAALTSLGALVPGLSDAMKYALVAGAVTGGGLTVIANAPNPAGAGILSSSRVFEGTGISPLGLLLGAMMPTVVAIVCFWFI
jgi:hypothetical protein